MVEPYILRYDFYYPVMGDLKAGQIGEDEIFGNFGVGSRNERGKRGTAKIEKGKKFNGEANTSKNL